MAGRSPERPSDPAAGGGGESVSEVTSEMLEAGLQQYRQTDYDFEQRDVVKDIYRAMERARIRAIFR